MPAVSSAERTHQFSVLGERRFDASSLRSTAPYAERLAATIPGARLQRIADSRAFVPEDQPEYLAEMVAAFVRETGTHQAAVRAHDAM